MFAAKDSLLTRPSGGYQISRSLRFNAADNAYLSRTPASSSSKTTWTFSTWFKRSSLDNFQTILSAGQPGSSVYLVALFFANNNLDLAVYGSGGAQEGRVTSTAVFRDMSAWYHVMAVLDTTNATSSNRLKLYINGSQITDLSLASYPPQNSIYAVNSTDPHIMGAYSYGTTTNKIDGYQTETYLIDGQALTPSSFGETNAQTGVWKPKAYSGSYGTNGFYLNFSDNSNTTAATLGKDYSGNGNNFLPNNFSVTAGVDNDSMVDVPTPYGVDTGAGGTVRGNYCTVNPLDGVNSATITEGNLKVANGGTATFRGTLGITGSSGKWYWEFTQQTAITSLNPIGYGIASLQGTPSHTASTRAAYYYTDLSSRLLIVIINGVQTNVSVATAIAINEVLQFAYDSDTGKVWVGKSNVWSDSTGGTTGNPATGANPTYTFASVDQPMTPTFDHAGVAYTATLNCGQRAFANTAPSGFKALCTQNLPTPTIGATTATQAGKFFNPVLWTGNGASTRAITGVGFQPDFTWIKKRDEALSHLLYDAVRTAGINKALSSNDTNSEANVNADATYGYLSSFDSDGISVARGTNGTVSYTNANSGTYVAWNWKANGSGSSNTAGTITSTVSANTTSGFSIVTYSGTGAAGTVGHGLGVAPSMIIVKERANDVGDWYVYHSSIGNTKFLALNLTSGTATASSVWNNTTPTSTVFSIGNDDDISGSGDTYVAYCFAEVAGYSSIGSYQGNASADGPFIYTGFKPAFIILKRADTTSGGYWRIYDSTRNTSNVVDKELYPNGADTEGTFTSLDFTSNGIKIRSSDSQFNASGVLFIYMAFAQNPFKYSLAR